MKKYNGVIVAALYSFWKLFRMIFVVFSLYLLGDVLYRWDGYRYHSTFLEFLPNVALISILWSIVALLVAMFVWLLLKISVWLCLRKGWICKEEHLSAFLGICIFLILTVWGLIIKEQHSLTLKLAALLLLILTAIFLAWLLRNKSDMFYERMTPLVWLMGTIVILSVLLVSYQTLRRQTDKAALQKINKSTEVDKPLPNILLVTYDALTAREMSLYGYHRPTTPFISQWAKTASLFTRAHANTNFTRGAIASLMTGKRQWTHRILQTDASMPINSDVENLPLLLRGKGYYNMAFNSNIHASAQRLNIADSFEINPPVTEFITPQSWYGIIKNLLFQLFGEDMKFYNWILKPDFILVKLLTIFDMYPPEFSTTEVPPEKTFNVFLTTIDNNLQEPFFAWIHLYPPHDPYLPPEPYRGTFNSSPKLRTLRSIAFIGWEDKTILEIVRARYDEFILYCDKQFENFIAQLEKRGKLKNTIIILSSDHGESFEHGIATHGGPHLYEQLTHIPLIIKEPNQTEGRIINDLVGQIDIPATILDLADIPVPSWMEGRSLRPLLRGDKIPSRPGYSMNFWLNPGRGYKLTSGTVAVWEGDYKLIHYFKENKSLLFNLKLDPGELNNLADQETEIAQRLLGYIMTNLMKVNEELGKE